MCLMLKLFVLTGVLCHVLSLHIGAFNIQVFGQRKAKKKDVMDIIVKVVERYDILLIQEIRDKTGFAINSLMNRLNEKSNEFSMVMSDRLGRSYSKEQYAFLYRNDIGVTLQDVYQDKDLADKFEREPFAAWFSSKNTEVNDFVLMGVHIAPKKVTPEMNELDDVRADVMNQWGINDVIIMGDMNADCRYLSKKRTAQLDLRLDGSYWLIPDDADTTVASSACAYDRFIVSGHDMVNSIVPGSARAYRFDLEFNLNQYQAKKVSDHYPIELQLKESGSGRYNLRPRSFVDSWSSEEDESRYDLLDELLTKLDDA